VTSWKQAVSGLLRALRLDSIRSKMLVFALLATLVPSVTTGWISYLQNKRSLSAKITGELQSVSAQTAREIDLWVKERLYELRVFAGSYEVSENLDRIPRAGGERARERLTGYLRSVRERFADYQELLVVNPEGEEVASTAQSGRGTRLTAPTTSRPSRPRYSRVAPSRSSSPRTAAVSSVRRISSAGAERDPAMAWPSAAMRYT